MVQGMGISFQNEHHLLGDPGTAPKPNNLLAVAPQNIITTTNKLFCACRVKS
jgi:hypothetical protein